MLNANVYYDFRGAITATGMGQFGTGTDLPILLDNMECSGNEASLRGLYTRWMGCAQLPTKRSCWSSVWTKWRTQYVIIFRNKQKHKYDNHMQIILMMSQFRGKRGGLNVKCFQRQYACYEKGSPRAIFDTCARGLLTSGLNSLWMINWYCIFPPLFPACPADKFQCVRDGRCIPANLRCNGRGDCYDESDEADCNSKLNQGVPLQRDTFFS